MTLLHPQEQDVKMSFIDTPGFQDTDPDKTDADNFTATCEKIYAQPVSTIIITCSNGAIDAVV